MSSTSKGSKAEKQSMDAEQLTQAFGFDPELYNEQKNNID